MSKLTKLIFHPRRFFYDAIQKRKGKTPGSKRYTDKITASPKNMSKAKLQIATSSSIDFNASAANLLLPFKIALQTGENFLSGKAHLQLWIPQFIASGELFLVITRDADLYKFIREQYPTLSVLQAKRSIDAERAVLSLPHLRAIFYPSSTGNNVHFIRFNHIKHIFIGHGDSDKASSAHKALRAYDEIWVAGQAHIDRFSNAGIETKHISFVKVGRPNLQSVMARLNNPWNSRFSGPSLLYLPTWEGQFEETNYSSLPFASDFLSRIYQSTKSTLFAKLHPSTGLRDCALINCEDLLRNALTTLGIPARIKDRAATIEDLLYQTNMFICDISGVLTECLAANAPIFVYVPMGRKIKLASSSMPFEEYAYTFSSTEELIEKINKVLKGEDVLAKNRTKAIEYFVGKKETLDGEFHRQVRAICQNKPSYLNMPERTTDTEEEQYA